MDKRRHKTVKVITPKIPELVKKQREDSNLNSLTSESEFLTTILYIFREMKI